MPGPSTPTHMLRDLCLAGMVLQPAIAQAGKGQAPGPPRCVPEPPSMSVEGGYVQVEPPPGPVHSLVVESMGRQWLFGDAGAVWQRHGGPWTAQPIATEGQVRAAHQGGGPYAVWAVGTEGGIWSYGREEWQAHALPGGVKPELQHVAVEGNQVVVAAVSGELYLSDDLGQRWVELGSGPAVRALDVMGATVAVAREGGGIELHARRAEGWTVTRRDGPEGRSLAQLEIIAVDYLLALDVAGDLWTSRDGGGSWTSDRPDHGDDPLVAMVPSALGWVGVHASGKGMGLSWGGRRPELVPLPDFAPMPGLVAAAGVADGGVLGVDGDGQVVQQELRVVFTGGHPCGRPLRVHGREVTAEVVRGSGWSRPVPGAVLPSATAAALADLWGADAVAEHASIGSFARFVLQLLALGAPAQLVADAQQGMADELDHARRCFALASRYAGEPRSPGPLPLQHALDGPNDLVSVSVAVLREGAVGESIGALLAAERQARASDPGVCASLAAIADDEARHARDAWRFLAWAVAEGGAPVRVAVVAAVEEAVASHLATLSVDPPEGVDAALWAAHGGLTAAQAKRAARRAVRGVIRPCLERLVA